MRWFARLLFLLLLISAFSVTAQQQTLTVMLPDTNAPVQEVLDQFAAENGVRVEVVPVSSLVLPPTSPDEVERYLDEIETYVSQADVLPVSSSRLAPAATRAGYFLDLTPFAAFGSVDSALAESFRWDSGGWAVPYVFRPVLLTYDPALLDATRLNTLADLENAALQLEAPALALRGNAGLLLNSALGVSSYDIGTGEPDFSDPLLAEGITTLAGLVEAGAAVPFAEPDSPLQITTSDALLNDETLAAAPLPGGRVGAVVEGFAVSAGTLNPDLAYALADLLANYPDVTNLNGALPARPDTGFTPVYDAETLATLEGYLQNLIPPAELRFSRYLATLPDALPVLESDLREALTQAANRQPNISIVAPPPANDAGDGAITFALDSGENIPNRAEWERLAAEFPGAVNLAYIPSDDSRNILQAADCFYTSYPGNYQGDFDQLLDIEPLLQSDPNYNPDDLVTDVFGSLRHQGGIIGLPLTIVPRVMGADPGAFEALGVPLPGADWTITEFDSTLRQIIAAQPDEYALSGRNFAFDSTDMLMLIAAYGGLPIDYENLTVDFTSQATVDSVRTVLDLIKNDHYQDLSILSREQRRGTQLAFAPLITSQYWEFTSAEGGLRPVSSGNAIAGRTAIYRVLPYPAGERYTPLGFFTGAAHITAGASDPQACYEFMSYLSRQPSLFPGMPIYRSLINDPATEAAQGPDAVALYRTIAETMQAPDATRFPGLVDQSLSDFYLTQLLLRAFRAYVFDDADLVAALTTEGELAQQYLDCLDSDETRAEACVEAVDATALQ